MQATLALHGLFAIPRPAHKYVHACHALHANGFSSIYEDEEYVTKVTLQYQLIDSLRRLQDKTYGNDWHLHLGSLSTISQGSYTSGANTTPSTGSILLASSAITERTGTLLEITQQKEFPIMKDELIKRQVHTGRLLNCTG